VVIGGLVSSTILTLFLMPLLYGWVFAGRTHVDSAALPSAATR
jgi:Cu/Ag efflux pump CusA